MSYAAVGMYEIIQGGIVPRGVEMMYTRFEALNIRHDYQVEGYTVKLEKQDNGLWMVYILTTNGWEAV
jgi:hypothetical protein